MSEATKDQVDALCKQVADLKELAENRQKEQGPMLEKMVEQILANHPGVTPPNRKVQFPEAASSHADEILGTIPKEIIAEIDNCFIASNILRKPVRELKMWGKVSRRMGEFRKALDAATSGGGSEWVPTDFSAQLYELVRLQLKVGSLFPMVQMPSNPYVLPVQLGRFQSFKQDEQTGDTGQTKIPVSDINTLTGKVTLTAQGHAVRVLTSKDLEEDSIVPILPMIQKEIIMALAEGREDAIINGDTTGTHQDSDVTTSGDRRKLWKGLRKIAYANSYKQDMSTFSTANIRALRAQMGKFGVNPADCAIITGIKGYLNNFLGLPEVITMEKYGPQATVVAGELARFDGMPVIVSEWVRENVNATAVYDGTTTTKRTFHIVNRNAFITGVKRGASIQILRELYAESDQDAMVTRERVDFEPLRDPTSNGIVAVGYNF